MEKPPFLYHATSNRNIEIFEPRAESIRDPNEGSVVFGTPSKAYVSMFIVKSNDSWTSKGRYNGVWYHAISDEERYRQLDKGGAIYTLPSDTFETDLTRGMKSMEWVSRVSVKPLEKEIYDSGIEAMLKNGVKVLFVPNDVFVTFGNLMKGQKIEKAFDLLFSNKPYNGIVSSPNS